MANVEFKGNWAGMEQFFIKLPEDLIKNIKATMKTPLKSASDRMRNNVSGAILHRQTGKTASSMTSSVRSRGHKVTGRAGTSWYIARFWEDGFNHKSKKGKVTHMAPREWAKPVREQVLNVLEDAVNRTIDQAINGLK